MVIFLTPGCYRALNYPDPAGPVYTGHYATRPFGTKPLSADSSFVEKTSWRVVTFNIEYGRKIDRALEVLQTEPTLASPDLLALQEMDAPGVERIARALHLDYVYYPSGLHPKEKRDFGCALLSPWPLEEPRKIALPHGARITGLQRVVAIATMQREDARIRVYSVHLPSPLGVSGHDRREQLETILADARTSPDPVIIAGDFNSEDAGEMFLKEGFTWITRDLGLTTDFLGVGFSFDHVFTKGLRLAPGEHSRGIVEENRNASDHLPVWVLLQLE